MYERHYRVPLSYDLTTNKILGEICQIFCLYFGPNDDTKRTYALKLTDPYNTE